MLAKSCPDIPLTFFLEYIFLVTNLLILASFAIWKDENFPNQVLVSFCLTVHSIYLFPLAFYYNQQVETRPHLHNFAENLFCVVVLYISESRILKILYYFFVFAYFPFQFSQYFLNPFGFSDIGCIYTYILN